MAYPKSHNPFADEDEEESGSSGGFDDPSYHGLSEAEKKQRYLQQEVMHTAKSAVDSSQRSLALIYESEKMGVETAEVMFLSVSEHYTLFISHTTQSISVNFRDPFLCSSHWDTKQHQSSPNCNSSLPISNPPFSLSPLLSFSPFLCRN